MVAAAISATTGLSAIKGAQIRPFRSCRTTVARASADVRQAAPVPIAAKAIGALAAVQLAIFPFAGPAMADSVEGPPLPNMTDGAETGSTRANYAGLGDIKGPNKPKDAFAAGADLPDSLGGGSVKAAAGAAADKVGENAKQLSKASDVLTGPGGAKDAK